ncbi:MAG: hypothetical protein K0R02_975 [Rickettsiaceae bacterium]|nr:hypothetical protein [Rickettsiaceae bacterium]
MRMYKLKNGSVVAEPVVITTMMNIKSLAAGKMGNNPMNSLLSVYELGKLAQDPKHKIFSKPIEDLLKGLALMQEDGTLHNEVKDIAQSAISFNGSMPDIHNPVVEVLGDDSGS